MAYPFKFHDYFDLDERLTDDVRMARDAVREWVNQEIVPSIEDHAMQATFSRDWFRQLGELGCYGPALPVEDGGHGLSETGYGVLMRELERGDTSIRSMASVQGSLVMYPISAFGSSHQKSQYLK
ncbi:MAG TPA: acyl-CoA dehydrogenase family protein, partial [Membranihabitans sp.]|nr:acyl-CoA dehydrogenase family protein [Membranihabitans sp.]